MCGSLAKDFHRLMKGIASFSNNQAKVCHFEENLEAFTVEIVPNDGVYCGGKFMFVVNPEDYPKSAPSVTCETRIYHPNIDHGSGDVCLNLLEEWTEIYSLEDCVQGLLFLLYNPNLEDPLSALFDPDCYSFDTFAENVRLSLEGGEVEGFAFERNLVNENDFADRNSESANFQCQNEATVNDAVSNIYDTVCDQLNNIVVTGNTETNGDSKANTKADETGDLISGKVHPHRPTEGDMNALGEGIKLE